MKTLTRGLLVMIAAAFLTHCSGQKTDTQTDEPAVRGARIGAEWTLRVARATIDLYKIRPSALLGAYVAEYMVHTSIFRGALAGVEAQMQLLFDDEFEEDASFALLQDLGSLLQVDIVDMLNRATDRPGAFDAYVESLIDLGGQSETHLARLEQELEDVQDERRLQRREVSRIQSALNGAIRAEDYSAASGLQREIIDAEAELARIESEEDERRSVIRLFENLLGIAEERLTAMNQNREPLIAGLRVVEVPGVEDLGLIEAGMRSRRRGSAFDSGLIDPNL